MARAGGEGQAGEGVGAVDHGGQENGAAAPQPIARNAPAAAAAAPVFGRAAVVMAALPAAAMLAVAVIPNNLPVPAVNAEPRFDVEGVLRGPLPRKSTMLLCEILPRVDEEEEP